MEIEVTCSCGHRMVISEFAMGIKLPCPACDETIQVSTANAKPLPRAAVAAPYHTPTPSDTSFAAVSAGAEQSSATVSRCQRCGKMFRGEWDKQQTVEGTLCHICANLVREADPDRPGAGYVAPVATVKLDAGDEPEAAIRRENPIHTHTKFEQFRLDEDKLGRIALIAGLVVILIALYFAAFDPGPAKAPEPRGAVVTQEAAETWLSLPFTLAYGLTRAVMIAVIYAAVFLYLRWITRLPGDTLTVHLLGVAVITMVIYVIHIFTLGKVLIAGALLYAILRHDTLRAPDTDDETGSQY